ncbi:MAG: hypothetical protein GX995_00295 [Clostridiales bacterium]|nr:hypothetical protein [Clostridiales bacterium]
MVMIQAHRGSSENYPENTMLAFVKAVEEGAGAIEMDVRRTLDGEYIIMHDASIDRTTNGTGNVTDLNWSYISTLDAGGWKGSEFADREDTKVPLLYDVLDYFNGENIILVLHLYISSSQSEVLVDNVSSRGMINQVHFFQTQSVVNHIESYNPDAFTQSGGMTTIDTYENYLQNAIDNNIDAVSVNANETASNLEIMIKDSHRAGKYVQASYLSNNYYSRVKLLASLGIDFILGNDVEAMVNALNDRSLMKADFYDTSKIKRDAFFIKEQRLVKTNIMLID